MSRALLFFSSLLAQMFCSAVSRETFFFPLGCLSSCITNVTSHFSCPGGGLLVPCSLGAVFEIYAMPEQICHVSSYEHHERTQSLRET
uniref:Putative secreted protein n=1 Tax=Ixodes ricinus TaxID=34613 RepID=A0A6B0UA35_IXORI